MASFRKRGDSWEAQIRRRGYPAKSATFDTKAQAERWARKVEREMDERKIGTAKQPLVSKILERFRDEVAPTRKGEKWETDRINKLLNECSWVDLRCDELTPDILRDYRDERLQVVTSGSVKREFALISGVISHAIREGWVQLAANPCSMVKRPKDNRARSQRVTDEELLSIVGDWRTAPRPATAVQWLPFMAWFAVETAMRLGEICALLHSDLAGDHLIARDTKNGTSRVVPLSSTAREILATIPTDGAYVFGAREGNAGIRWREATKAAGLEHIQFRDLRREATSRLAKKLDVLELAKLTGHMDLRVLLKVYYQLSPSDVSQKLG